MGMAGAGRGYLSPYFITHPDKRSAILEELYILIHEKMISAIRDLLPVLEEVSKAGKPLLILADDVVDGTGQHDLRISDQNLTGDQWLSRFVKAEAGSRLEVHAWGFHRGAGFFSKTAYKKSPVHAQRGKKEVCACDTEYQSGIWL